MQGRFQDIVTAAGGRLMQGDPDAVFAGISIDSRTIAPGEVFVAVRGEVHDGHAFLPQVLAAGARRVVVVRAITAAEDPAAAARRLSSALAAAS